MTEVKKRTPARKTAPASKAAATTKRTSTNKSPRSLKGQKFYIIHGWTYTTAPWTQTIAELEKQGLEVEMINVPGLTAPSKKVWTIEDYVNFADRKIPKDAIALGHSNGGRILLNLLSAKSDKLKHLILLDAAGVYQNDTKRDVARSLSKKLGFLKKVPGVTKVWHKLTGASDYARAPENMKKTLSNMLDSDKKLDLTKVTTPTSILWGAADTVTPPDQAEIMHEQLPNNTLTIYPAWTHAPYLSHPQELAKAIIEALQNPPEAKPIISDAAKNSAALALKKAPEPVLKPKGSGSAVVADVPTKLVLKKGEKITAGMMVSDAEGAAVRYGKSLERKAQPVTDVQSRSASQVLKKNHAEKTAEKSPQDAKSAKTSKLAKAVHDARDVKENGTGLIEELSETLSDPVEFVPTEVTVSPSKVAQSAPIKRTITSAEVPKVSKLERAKRKIKGKK